MRDFLWGALPGFGAILVGLFAGAGCASVLAEVDEPCDPGLFTARMQAYALECRAARMRECPGVSQEAFERNVLLCPAALKCYHHMDQEALSCVGR